MSFEGFENVSQNVENGESLINRIEEGDMSVSDLLERNRQTIEETSKRMAATFAQTITDKLPKEYHSSFANMATGSDDILLNDLAKHFQTA